MKRLTIPFVKIWDAFDRFLCHALMPTGLRLRWRALWCRKDEFHPCYDIDVNGLTQMDEQEAQVYHFELARRRTRAHNKDLLVQ